MIWSSIFLHIILFRKYICMSFVFFIFFIVFRTCNTIIINTALFIMSINYFKKKLQINPTTNEIIDVTTQEVTVPTNFWGLEFISSKFSLRSVTTVVKLSIDLFNKAISVLKLQCSATVFFKSSTSLFNNAYSVFNSTMSLSTLFTRLSILKLIKILSLFTNIYQINLPYFCYLYYIYFYKYYQCIRIYISYFL